MTTPLNPGLIARAREIIGDGSAYFAVLLPPLEFPAMSAREKWLHDRWVERYTRRYGHPPQRGEVGQLWGVRVSNV